MESVLRAHRYFLAQTTMIFIGVPTSAHEPALRRDTLVYITLWSSWELWRKGVNGIVKRGERVD